jgi:hypothetical protein
MPLFNVCSSSFADRSILPEGYCRSYETVKEEKILIYDDFSSPDKRAFLESGFVPADLQPRN